MQIYRCTDWIAEKARMHILWILSAFALFYLLLTCFLAVQKACWYDELFTIQLARLPVAGIWSELAKGTDLQPPLVYILTRASMAVFGDNPVAARLPAIIGFLVMSMCIYRFVSRWCPPLYALAAMLFPITTATYDLYAFEARPYGMVLGCCGIALVCWQAAAHGEGRPWSLAGLALAVAVAVSCHYYSVLLLVPLGVGELLRAVSRRRLDLPVALALAVGVLPLAAFWPLIAGARAYVAGFDGMHGLAHPIFETYAYILKSSDPPLVALLVFMLVYHRFRPRPEEPVPALAPSAPEIGVIVTLVALPFIGMALAKGFTNAYRASYVLCTIVGLAVGLAFLVHRHARSCSLIGCVLVIVLGGWICVKEVSQWHDLGNDKDKVGSTCRSLVRENPEGLPVVISEPGIYLQLHRYAGPDLADRLVYLQSRELAMRYLNEDTPERALAALKPLAELNVERYRDFLATHREFLVHGQRGWLFRALIVDGADVQMRGPGLFLVRLSPEPTVRAVLDEPLCPNTGHRD